MLKVYLYDEPDKNKLIHDVEHNFYNIRVKDTPMIRRILKEIEKAEYLSETAFIDRFGYKMHITDLSTGSKAAITLVLDKESIIDTIECGENVIEFILENIHDGSIKLSQAGLCVDADISSGIVVDGEIMTDICDLE